MLQVENLSCGYNGSDVIFDVNFSVSKNDKLCIVGPNGCGKTTLLKAIMRLLPYNGNVYLNNANTEKLSERNFAKEVALLSQSSAIYFPYTVFDTVSLGRYAHQKSFFGKLSKDDNDIIKECLEAVHMYEQKDKLISELSGGQLQRVYLARTFAQDPKIIMLDEPTNHLDLKSQLELFAFLEKWAKDKDKTIIGVFHDLNNVISFANKVILLKDGKIIANGETKDVLSEDNLQKTYNVNVRQYMVDTLNLWK